MAKQIQISEGQSLLDVCLQTLGDVGAIYDLADANGLAITDALVPGQVLNVPETVLSRPEVAAYFSRTSLRVNTNNNSGAVLPPDLPTALPSFFHPNYFDSEYYG